MGWIRAALRMLAYAWASPNTALGLVLGLLVMASGGRAHRRAGVLELSGGGLARELGPRPGAGGFCAITFGHVIIGLDESELDRVRAHEHVHVRQCERWGPFFLPAYLMSSLWQVLRGRRAYLDNAFEREAYEMDERASLRRGMR